MQPMRAVGLTAMAVAWAIATSTTCAAVEPLSSFEDTFAVETQNSQPSESLPTAPPAVEPTAPFTPDELTSATANATTAGATPPQVPQVDALPGTDAASTQASTATIPSPLSATDATTTGVASSSTTSEGTGGGAGVPMFNGETPPIPAPAPAPLAGSPTVDAISTSSAGNGATPSTGNGAAPSGVSEQMQGEAVQSPASPPAAAVIQTPPSTLHEQATAAPITTATAIHPSTGNSPPKEQAAATTTPAKTKRGKRTKTPSPSNPSSGSSSSNGKGSDDVPSSSSGSMDADMSNACLCNDVRKVSLMSAADYCLLPGASIGDKCGNPKVAEKGECPKTGAQPCQDTGHVLTNDSVCAYDKRDETYKCVASKEDLYIQKHGKAKKKSNSTSANSPLGQSSVPSAKTATQLVLLVASLVVGLVAVV